MRRELMSGMLPVLLRRALAGNDPSLLQLGFDVAVLDRYREDAAYKVIRTDTVGRLSKQGGWSIDFGIAPGDAQIHASWQAFAGMPDRERGHWATHATAVAAFSDMFLRMQLSPGSCFDDGDVRAW
jgi:hypothetical protein